MNKHCTFTALTTAIVSLLFTACKPAMDIATPATPDEITSRIHSAGKLTLVHVWATWCDPCRDEFPELVHVFNEFQSLETILISADDPEKPEQVEAFLQAYNSPVGSLISTELNQSFINSLSPEWSGALPATFIYQDGKLIAAWEGKRTFRQYADVIQPLINQ